MSDSVWFTVAAPVAAVAAFFGGVLWFNNSLVKKRRYKPGPDVPVRQWTHVGVEPTLTSEPGNFYTGQDIALNYVHDGEKVTPEERRHLLAQAPEQIGEVQIMPVQGWITLSLTDLFAATPVLKSVFAEYRATVGQWAHQIPQEWWQGIRAYPRVSAMTHANHMRTVLNEDELKILKMKMTACALIFDKAIPQACFLLNEKTIEMVLRYLALTETAQVTIEKVDVWEEFLPMPHRLDLLVNNFLCHPPIASNLFSDTDRPPSLWCVANLLVPTLKNTPQLTDNQVRKILTCIYLAAGISIPMDFLYIDMDVHDFVLKHGEYERVTA